MTEIAVRTEPAAELATQPALAPTGTVASLAHWALEARAAHQLATSLVATSFVPEHFRGKPAEATAAILTGHELGMSPMASLQAIHVIKGRPGLYAKAMVAVVQAAGHEVWIEEQSNERVIVCGQRKGSQHIARTIWDRDRVVLAKLTSNSKYQESPQQMYTARGQAEICRQIAPDALFGIPYTVEELGDMPSVGGGVPVVEPVRAERVTAAEILGVAVETEPGNAGDEFGDEVSA